MAVVDSNVQEKRRTWELNPGGHSGFASVGDCSSGAGRTGSGGYCSPTCHVHTMSLSDGFIPWL